MSVEPLSAIAFDVVVAVDLDDGIGKAGEVPWRLPADLAHFRSLTRDSAVPGAENAVIMGRRTWDSIPERFRPLPGRLNCVVSGQVDLRVPDGVMRADSLAHGLERVRPEPAVDRLFVIGGGQIYRRALELDGCRHIYMTRVLGHFDCDTFFPPIPSTFRRDALLAEGRDNDLAYRIEQWTCTR